MSHKILRTTIGAFVTAAVLTLSNPSLAGEGGDTQPDPQQIARGAKAWAENCNRCHNMRDPREMEDYEWYVSTTHMRVVAGLPGDMTRDIRAFLMSGN